MLSSRRCHGGGGSPLSGIRQRQGCLTLTLKPGNNKTPVKSNSIALLVALQRQRRHFLEEMGCKTHYLVKSVPPPFCQQLGRLWKQRLGVTHLTFKEAARGRLGFFGHDGPPCLSWAWQLSGIAVSLGRSTFMQRPRPALFEPRFALCCVCAFVQV